MKTTQFDLFSIVINGANQSSPSHENQLR